MCHCDFDMQNNRLLFGFIVFGLCLFLNNYLILQKCFSSNDIINDFHRHQLNKKQKRILVTGGAGFIGHHVIMLLKHKGLHVIGIDNFNDYYDITLKYTRANISGSVMNMDVCDSKGVDTILEKNNITHIIHMAAQAGVRYSITHPEAYIRSNVECFVKLLENIKFRDIELIYASSSSVYGRNKKIPFTENDRVDLPVSLYAATKRENELLANVYWNLYKQRSVGLRFFTVYGPLGRPDMAYYSFVKNIYQGHPINVYNHGRISRDFTYIDDVAAGIVSSLDFYFECDILNIGRGEPKHLMIFINIIEHLLAKKAILNFTDISKADVLITYADIKKAKRTIGYNPTVSLDRGLAQFIKWYKQYEHANKRNTLLIS